MLFTDLIGSISHALPQLVEASTRHATDDEIFGPKIGYAFLRPDSFGKGDAVDLSSATMWSSLHATTLGVLGSTPIGQVVATAVRQRFGADVIRYPMTTAALGDCADVERCRSLDDVLAARVLCVALPWGGDLSDSIVRNRFNQLNPQLVLVVWRRSRAIERAIAYLGKHYAEPVQLCNLAQVACISKCHLVRLFTATLGMSPHRYQLVLRLSRAKTMLREGTCITQIAQGVGFFDHSHLDRSFRILIGMTPTQYQQSVAR
jgi:AraC-like DNA-binding protein